MSIRQNCCLVQFLFFWCKDNLSYNFIDEGKLYGTIRNFEFQFMSFLSE